MPRNKDMDAAVRAWDEAHQAALTFYAENDITEPDNWERWLELRNVEDDARFDADQLIDEHKPGAN